MLIFADMLRKANIKFELMIFTNNPQECEYEEIHFYKQRFDIWDYLADADYTVLLSDSEGCPYTIQESLLYNVPCIVTDVGGCTELIKDGINGYVVPLNMQFDITKILNIPKLKEYNNHALEDWLNYLGDSLYIEKGEEKVMNYLVKATSKYQDENISDIQRSEEESKKKGENIRYVPKEGEEWIVDMFRKNNLVEKGFVTVVKEIKEEEKKIETAVKEIKKETAVKKTTKTAKKTTTKK